MIVNSPGIDESDHVKSIFMDNLSQANAFIYMINSPQAGGLQEDMVSNVKHFTNQLAHRNLVNITEN